MKNKLVSYIDLELLNVEEKAIFQLSEEETTIELAPNPIWITAKVSGNETYLLKCKISSETLGANSPLFQVQFLDKNKNIIEGPYDGFSLSQIPSIGNCKYLPLSKTMSEVLIIIKTLPNTCYIKGGFRSWANISPVNLESKLEILNFSSLGKRYTLIWNLLNQPSINLENLNNNDFLENFDLQIESNYCIAYFNATAKYQELKLESIENREYPWLESLGIENFTQFLENIQKCQEYEAKSSKYINNLDINAIKNGYLEYFCPWSGKILSSNESYLINNQISLLFYRFIGYKVFYLIIGSYSGGQLALYFPSAELIIEIKRAGSIKFPVYCNTLKSYVISKWQNVISYLSKKKPKDLVSIAGAMNHFGHTLLNEYPSYDELSENNLLINFKKYLIGGYEFIPFDKLFPEVNEDDIIRKPEYNSLEMFEYVLKNNYFIIRPTNEGYNLNRSIAKRINSASVKSSSETCLEKIEILKKHFPVLWFEIRTNDRIWLNQAEGIAEIANQLYSNYPNLAIIFAGWSRMYSDNTFDEKLIEEDQRVVEQSKKFMNSEIVTVNLVGAKINEKIAWANVANIHIVTYGSGCIFASIANKPTVIHANTGWYPSQSIQRYIELDNPGWKNIVSVVPIENITEDQSETHFHVKNYYCNWEGIYQEIVNILNKLKLEESENNES